MKRAAMLTHSFTLSWEPLAIEFTSVCLLLLSTIPVVSIGS